jgi:hypothetical protein
MRKIIVTMLLGGVIFTPFLVFREYTHQKPLTTIGIVQEHISNKRLANAIAKSKFPAQLTVIALKENPQFRGHITSDGGQSRGYFMIQQKHWGKFGKTPEQQVAKAEQILEALIRESDASRRWNGSGEKAKIYKADFERRLVEVQSV